MKRKLTAKLRLQDILHFNGTVRIPVSGSVPLAEEVRLLIQTPAFQRLRGVRQLGPTHFVYPGAIHTRFEHSLGTYALSLKYVEALLVGDEIYAFEEKAGDMAKLLIASSLLHDIGHYPFSHLIEEIGELPGVKIKNHECRAEEIILGTSIKTILKHDWKIDPYNVCKAINKGIGLKKGFAVMANALHSVLDLDKLDYLIRDSVHCGVNFGFFLDKDRFLAGLRIDSDNARICLSAKAESYIPAIITVRNLMYNEVYWHKTVRAGGAMLKTLLYRLCESNAIDTKTLKQLLHSQDDRFAFQLYELAKKRRNATLRSLASPFVFHGRELFKMIYAFGMPVAHAKPNARLFFSDILGDKQVSVAKCLERARVLEKAIRRRTPAVKFGDLLLECTPVKKGHETFDLKNMMLYDERTTQFIQASYELSGADSLLDNTRRVFVFCNPARAKICRNFSSTVWEQIYADAFDVRSARKTTEEELMGPYPVLTGSVAENMQTMLAFCKKRLGPPDAEATIS